jgi:hypothetical protein
MNEVEHLQHEAREIPRTKSTVGEQLPKAMGPSDMARAFGITYETFRRRNHKGEFRPFELSRPIGKKKWSGEAVQRFLNGRVTSVNGRVR